MRASSSILQTFPLLVYPIFPAFFQLGLLLHLHERKSLQKDKNALRKIKLKSDKTKLVWTENSRPDKFAFESNKQKFAKTRPGE